jgi:hypothetical protein
LSDPAARAERLRSALVDGDAAALATLLHPDACLRALGRTLQGAADVQAELLAATTRAAWQALRWTPAVAAAGAAGRAARLHGERAAGTRDRGLVVTLLFDGDRVRELQLQRVPPPPPPATAMVLPAALRDLIDRALVERRPMLMAHVAEDGQPVMSYRGSVQVTADDQLGLWVRNAQGGFVRAIGLQPRVSFMVRHEDSRATYQLQGRARISHRDEDRRRIFDHAPEAERAHDFAMLGVAVLVDLDHVEGYAGVGPQGQIGQIHLKRGA